MRFLKGLLPLTAMLLGANAAHAGGLSYTCDPTIAASTCNYLNTTVAGIYDSTFTNVNADIYITLGTTGLGQGEPIFNYNQLPYSTFVSDYAANASASGNPAQASGLASLNTFAAPIYAGTNISLSGALGEALGIPLSNLVGYSSTGNAGCALNAAGCYEDVITITNDPGTPLYYRTGGPIAPDAYDFYSTVEHETDEALGTQSCIQTQTPPNLGNNCSGTGNESANDLFRYQGPGSLVNLDVPDAALSTTPGAYLSADGGVTNGLGTGRFYNTLVNGSDYADFDSDNTVCNGGTVADSVQDESGCPGADAGLDIGSAEIAMLNDVGFDLPGQITGVPEPMSMALLLPGVIGLIGLRSRKRRAVSA